VPCEEIISESPLPGLGRLQLIREVGLKFIGEPEDITPDRNMDDDWGNEDE
jgi:hypothetical protein